MKQLLLEWVFTSIFLILTVLALRALLGKRVSAELKYALWAVVLIRLLVPVQLFTSPLAGTWVVTQTQVEQSLVEWPSAPAGPGDAPSLNEQDAPALEVGPGTVPDAPDLPTVPNAPDPPAAPDLTRIPVWLGWVWLAGALVMAAAFLLSNLSFALRLRRVRTPLEGAECPLPVYIADGLPSPCLFGLFRPAVYVTVETAQNPAMLRHILAHEHTHFRHGDHIWNVLRSAALAVHWWNPLVWLAVILSRRDCELACDEGALKGLGDDERIAYGRTLLSLITEKPRPGDLLRCATTMTGGQKSVFDRVTRIAKAPKRWLWAAVAAVVATALACVCAFGQAEETSESDPWDPSGVTADLTFSLETDSVGNTYVRMDGTVDGVELPRGAFWNPEPSAFEEFPDGYLSMVYPGFTNGIEGHVTAGWTDEGHTSVTASTQMTAMLSSLFNVGYWDFTVELDSGAVSMEGLSFRDGLPDGETRFYPESISEEEAVRAARIAAKLLNEAEKYYDDHSAGEPASHFATDVENVPAEVLSAIGEDVKGKYEQFLLNLDDWPIAAGNSGMPEFDGWRVENLEGPFENDIRGVRVEIWRVNYEYHADDPVKAEYMLVGGMYVTEDGWLCPTYSNCTYYVFILDEQGNRRLGTVMMANGCGPDSGAAPERFYRSVEQALAMELAGLSPQADLDRDGVPETLDLIGQSDHDRLEVRENGELLYEEEGYFAHAGYNALFLCTLDGEDYLLRYHPTMYQGFCTYNYQLFTLENGSETVVREDSLEFDINFHPLMGGAHQFDVNEIVSFMDEINELLSHSVQLLNTDSELLATFEREGRLYDNLGWLDQWEPVYVRGEGTLPDELWAFKAAM